MSTLALPHKLSGYRDPLRPALWGLIAILSFIALCFAWGYAAPLSSAAIAEGSLQVMAQRQSVQHPHGGVIARLLVTEGQPVERGQPLIKLDGTEARAGLDIANAEVVALLAQQARLICERDDAGDACLTSFAQDNHTRPGIDEAVANENAVMLARARQFQTEKGMLSSKVAQLHERIAGLQAQLEGLSKQRISMDDELESARKLFASGLVSRTRILELDRAIAQVLADEGSRRAEIASARLEIAGAELAVARLDRERITNITDQLRSSRAALAEAQPKLEAARIVAGRTVIQAPVSGSIVDLAVFTEGGVIQPGQRLMDIVPDNNPIIVEARLPLSDINGIEPGVAADIRLTGVPRAVRPRLRGEILSLSADKITDAQSGTSYFAVRVKLNPEDARQAQIPLRPGMPAEVVIPNGSRTVAGYLLGPLIDEITHAFREE